MLPFTEYDSSDPEDLWKWLERYEELTGGQVLAIPHASNLTSGTIYANSIGDPELVIVWRDPDFDAAELAFYYVRVIEIPTPKWTAYDAKYFGLRDLPPEVPLTTQERAYTSPIWYNPARD